MSCSELNAEDLESPGDLPYKDLYIYYLDGRLKSDEAISGNDFLGNWQEDDFSFLFFSKPSRDKIEKILRLNPELSLIEEFNMPYDQWQGDRIAPFEIGRFRIVPPWQTRGEKTDSPSKKLTIILDPGVVFGNGLHTTTQDCLEAIKMVFRRGCIESAFDFGTGTGLLALAVSTLGCNRTLAVDFNFLAAKTAMKNVRINRLESKIQVVQGRAEDFIDSPSDLMIANIHYDVMKHLISSPGFLRKKWFVLSGLMRSQARDVRYQLSQDSVQIIKEWERDGIWHTFLGRIG